MAAAVASTLAAHVGGPVALGGDVRESTTSKSTIWIRGTPMAASCMPTCRPMAPTPITVTLMSARRSRGTRSSCRWKRFWFRRHGGPPSFEQSLVPRSWNWRSQAENQSSSQGSTCGGRSRAEGRIGSAEERQLGNLHVGQVFFLPRRMVAGGKGAAVIHADRQIDIAAGADVEPQPGVALAAAGEDEHHCPFRPAKHARKRFLVGHAGLGGIAGMGMQPERGRIVPACGP